jgi:hypothetical protein
MAAAQWEDQEITLIAEMRAQGKSWVEIGEHFGKSADSVRCAAKRAARRGLSPEHDMNKTVPDGYYVKGVSTYYNAEGSVRGQWVKSDVDKQRQFELMQEAIQGLVGELPTLPPLETRLGDQNESLLSVYGLGDPHFGMLSWDEETGENFDLKIAERIFTSSFQRLVDAAPDSEEAIVANMGDYFHRDGIYPVTSRSGHMLDVDGRYARMVQVGMRVMRFMIEAALRKHKKVRVVNVIGNHDSASAMFLSIALAHIYEATPALTVDTSPSVFNYYEFGKCLLGFHHGHTCKPDKLPGVMSADQAEAWGRTKFRKWFQGHVHHEFTKEYPGVTVESINTLAAKDEYAHSGGWRAQRSSKLFVFHKEFGEVERHTVNTAMISGNHSGEDT